jgi:hypothetical protein
MAMTVLKLNSKTEFSGSIKTKLSLHPEGISGKQR